MRGVLLVLFKGVLLYKGVLLLLFKWVSVSVIVSDLTEISWPKGPRPHFV